MSYLGYFDGFALSSHIHSIPVFENRPFTARITLAIPTFKRVSTLRYAIMSALSQDYSDYEIIVVDNNPERNDDTELFMRQYKDVPNLSYYKNSENIGLFGNWNRCYELSRGEWVSLLHDDDYYFPCYLSTMIKWLDAFPNVQGLYCNRKFWYDNKEKDSICSVNLAPYKQHGISKIRNYMLFISHPVGPVGIFFKKENVIKMGGYNPNCYPIADYAFNWRYALKYGIYYIDTILVHYRIGTNVSIKPETIEAQEEKNLEIRLEYAKNYRFHYILDKISRTTYVNNMAIAQANHPNYAWKSRFSFKKNIYFIIRKLMLLWHNNIYIRMCSKSKIIV